MTGRSPGGAGAGSAGVVSAATQRRGSALLIAAGLVVAVAGCESSTAGRGTAVSAPSASGPGQSSSAATASPVPSPPAAPSTPAAPADGANTSACADGRCQVSVRTGTVLPVPASTRVRDLRVAAVTDDRVTLTGRNIGNSSSGVCTGQCDISSSNAGFTIKLGSNSRATQNGVAITVQSITTGGAVLQLEPAN